MISYKIISHRVKVKLSFSVKLLIFSNPSFFLKNKKDNSLTTLKSVSVLYVEKMAYTDILHISSYVCMCALNDKAVLSTHYNIF